VPSFLLQPLAENAVKYGVAPSRRPVSIRVEARQDGEDLVVSVEDDGGQAFGVLPKGGTGVGLANIRKRLSAAYGGRGQLEATARERGWQSTVRLPLHRAAAPDSVSVAA
jgi:LytS/YehU family sensor histidine kinase